MCLTNSQNMKTEEEKQFRKYENRSCKHSRFQLTSNQTVLVKVLFWDIR